MFNKEIIKRVWGKALPLLNDDPNRVRKDKCGAWIVFDEYGNRNSQFGWEIDHQKPLALDGTYDLANLVPMQWNNNRTKGDNYPTWKTSKTSFLDRNIDDEKSWRETIIVDGK